MVKRGLGSIHLVVADSIHKIRYSVNNCALWDQEFGDHFYHVVKFVFKKKEVEFFGFQIREDAINACAATVVAIRQFARPQNNTGMREWFELV